MRAKQELRTFLEVQEKLLEVRGEAPQFLWL